MTVNVPLLREQVAWVIDQAGKPTAPRPGAIPAHRQGAWANIITNSHCKTAFCVAGRVASKREDLVWAAYPHERQTMFGQHVLWNPANLIKRLPEHGDRLVVEVPYPPEQGVQGADEVAREMLGLTRRQASLLFAASNGSGRIASLAWWFARQDGQDLGLDDKQTQWLDPRGLYDEPQGAAALTQHLRVSA